MKGMAKTRHDKWTARELAILVEEYENEEVPMDKLAKTIGRTKGAVKAKAERLGMYRPPKSSFTKEQDAYIKANYRTMTYGEIGEVIGRNAPMVNYRARQLGLKKHKKGGNRK